VACHGVRAVGHLLACAPRSDAPSAAAPPPPADSGDACLRDALQVGTPRAVALLCTFVCLVRHAACEARLAASVAVKRFRGGCLGGWAALCSTLSHVIMSSLCIVVYEHHWDLR